MKTIRLVLIAAIATLLVVSLAPLATVFTTPNPNPYVLGSMDLNDHDGDGYYVGYAVLSGTDPIPNGKLGASSQNGSNNWWLFHQSPVGNLGIHIHIAIGSDDKSTLRVNFTPYW